MSTSSLFLSPVFRSPFAAKVDVQINVGRFTIKTLETEAELAEAFALRYQVFQVEMVGQENRAGIDTDEFDLISDHLAIFDSKTQQMIATCRLNCSLFSEHFYSQQEFQCTALFGMKQTKLEIGRVCVHRDFRKGIVIMLLWRALADYMNQTKTQVLFGCASVMTEDPFEAMLLYRSLQDLGKIRTTSPMVPTDKYRSREFEKILLAHPGPLSAEQSLTAAHLLPPLCRSYFDIGCYSPGFPAFDHEFKCIDFLTVLEIDNLNPQLRRKMLSSEPSTV